ncbi:MAG: SoxR reducing system RseC family protein [Bacteroidales bacterium]|nr:SoxR reducing system RseC family protein [Bacteroidales bacterium]
MAKEVISHKGRVVAMTPQKTSVEFAVEGACSSCRAAGLCGMGEYREKLVEVPTDPYARYGVGDEVEVVLKGSMGLKAVWLAYVIPVAILLAGVLVSGALGAGELLSAGVGVGIVAVYYFAVWLFRDKLENEYIFTIKG